METAVVSARCRRTGDQFAIRFEDRGEWTAVGTERRGPDGASGGTDISDGLAMSGGTDISDGPAVSGGTDIPDESGMSDGLGPSGGPGGSGTPISGPFRFAAEYEGCPECGDGSFFHCFDCDNLLCWDGETDPVKCPWCGQTCHDEGDVGSLDATRDDGQAGSGGDSNGLTRR